MDEEHKFDFGLSKEITWIVVLKEDKGSQNDDSSDLSQPSHKGDMEVPAQCYNSNPGELLIERRDNEAQEIFDIRRDLAQLAGWRGFASKEATSLAEAIEVTMNTLCPWEITDPTTWMWTIQVDLRAKEEVSRTFPVSLHLYHQKGQWKAPIDELNAALSSWLASIDKEQELASAISETKKTGDDDEWYRKRSSQIKGGLVFWESVQSFCCRIPCSCQRGMKETSSVTEC